MVLPLPQAVAALPVRARSLRFPLVERMTTGGAKTVGAALHGLAWSRAVRALLLLHVRKRGRRAGARIDAKARPRLLGLLRNDARDREHAAACHRLLPVTALTATPVRNEAEQEGNGVPLRECRSDILPRGRAASRSGVRIGATRDVRGHAAKDGRIGKDRLTAARRGTAAIGARRLGAMRGPDLLAVMGIQALTGMVPGIGAVPLIAIPHGVEVAASANRDMDAVMANTLVAAAVVDMAIKPGDRGAVDTALVDMASKLVIVVAATDEKLSAVTAATVVKS